MGEGKRKGTEVEIRSGVEVEGKGRERGKRGNNTY